MLGKNGWNKSLTTVFLSCTFHTGKYIKEISSGPKFRDVQKLEVRG
jgi:hypothetical protein